MSVAPGFASLVASPLLIPHLRSAGGAGGRRIHAGLDDSGAFAVVVEDGRGAGAPRAYGSALAAIHGYNAELDRAHRDGLGCAPEAARLSEQTLLQAVALRG